MNSIIYILDILHLLFIRLIEKRERNCYFYIINMIKKVRSLLFFFTEIKFSRKKIRPKPAKFP